MYTLANQNFSGCGARAVAGGVVGGISDNCELQPLRVADKAVQHVAAINTNSDSDPNPGDWGPSFSADFVQFVHCFLHFQCCTHRMLLLSVIGFRSAEDGKNPVTGKAFYGTAIGENGLNQRRKVFVQEITDPSRS